MVRNSFAPEFSDLPDIMPIFPLSGVLLLPGGTLPLNVFEPRYLAMVEAALAGDRIIGVIQPKEPSGDELYGTGCAGKITEFSETEDGRYMISLSGICRYDIAEELKVESAYRQVRPDWGAYERDLEKKACLGLDRDQLKPILQSYFQREDMSCDWSKVEEATDAKLITCLSMACPFEPQEKQALLEAECCKGRAKLFMRLLEFAVKSDKKPGPCTAH